MPRLDRVGLRGRRGCLAFFTDLPVGRRRLTAVGVVMGQGKGSDTPMILAAAGEAAKQLVDSVVAAAPARSLRPPRLVAEIHVPSRLRSSSSSVRLALLQPLRPSEWRE